ncbi:hypothetical protein C4K25_5895 [Pseudomonas chlororaphis]|nr:hypothetical protein C4K25_5895 [Pseudomonas chlororaphis]
MSRPTTPIGTRSGTSCTCNECGRMMTKAKKIHREKRYCETCYVRLFRRQLCPNCCNFARLPLFDLAAVCRSCEVKKPCVRCHRTGRKIGRLTAEGPACSSCSHYFKAPESCERCGKPSTRLVRVELDDQQPRCCPACLSSLTTSCCAACRRPRVIFSHGERPLCKKCYEIGEVECSTCGSSMPAGLGRECAVCTWTASFEKRRNHLLADLDDERVIAAVHSYSTWLLRRRGAHFAALNLHRYLPFLKALYEKWVTLPDYATVVDHFGAETLRRSRSVVRWLHEDGQIQIDPRAREDASERRRIEQSLQFFQAGPAKDALLVYHSTLVNRPEDDQLKLLSVRLALSSALRLLYHCDKFGLQLPTQHGLRSLLSSRPGLYASLYGFVTFLNRQFALDLVAQFDKRWLSRASRHVAEARLRQLYAKAGESGISEREWISVALVFFHRIKRVPLGHFEYEGQNHCGQRGFQVRYQGKDYWVPNGC